ncbi:MAG: amidohydrolase family protein [Planctomycetota bacterium]
MIVDCHTRIWSSPSQLGQAVPAGTPPRADEARHAAATQPVDRAIVLALKSRHLRAEIPNRFVADYVRRNPGKFIGFAGIDPTELDWRRELRIAQDELGLKGVVISPPIQDFHPADSRAMPFYEECLRRGLPVVIDQELRPAGAKLDYGRPALWDEVAQAFPDLRLVLGRLGHPWVAEAVVLLGKHAHVYADIAGLLPQPWLSCTALHAAFEYEVLDKLLFGSGFPFCSPTACIEALYSINQFAQGGSLPPIPRERLRGIVERDALALLGIADVPAPTAKVHSPIFADEE